MLSSIMRRSHSTNKTTSFITYLTLPVDANYTAGRFMWGSNENGVRTDPIHVYTLPAFQVIKVDVSILGDQINNVVLGTRLQQQK